MFDLEEYNPWWVHEGDPDFEEWRGLKYRYVPSWIRELSFEPFSVNFLVGPRRVGKTLGVKLLINELLRERENPYGIFYYDCTMLDNQDDLSAVLKAYLKLKETKGIKNSLIFLDEVTSAKNWWKAIIDLINRKKLKNDVITVMGSVSVNLNRAVGYFSGRKGRGKVLEIMPLGFRDYYHLLTGVEDYFAGKGQDAFESYLRTGGYAAYLNRRIRKSDIVGALKADLRSLEREKNPEIAREILGAIISKAPSPLSYSELGQEAGVNRDTVRSYVSALSELKVLLEIPFSQWGKKIVPKKNRKFAIRDPLMARAFAEWSHVKVEESVLYEWAVQEHLYRKFRKVYYFQSEGYEIDAVVPGMRVEVKSGKAKGRYPRDVIVLSGSEVPRFLHRIEYRHVVEYDEV
ncbi:ATP-binding protein [Thermococcus sp. Bubb.Bath]|uniref:ATP-binding protein n=1 Tax=Thermococcus sp. Bubb.Bath TaxID=1638242 RepID=UPI00143B95BD|nr:ATP-binding protein [Thermococcus sp. Bubb.Bath]NJF25670.1 ATP-binding protein [Thermococcus sp. Bubb.Bath]